MNQIKNVFYVKVNNLLMLKPLASKLYFFEKFQESYS